MSALATKFGRFLVPETTEALLATHVHDPETIELKAVDHAPRVGVLDQEDFAQQGIDTAALVPGAPRVDALGACTAFATLAKLSSFLSEDAFVALVKKLAGVTPSSAYGDVVTVAKAAIVFYHRCTDQTGQKGSEWPPTDCGSSGPYVVELLQALGVASGAKIASGATNIVSLMQSGSLLVGQPFLNAWMTPNAEGFIDGDGSAKTLRKQMSEGVAGGHETVLFRIVDLVLNADGSVNAQKTVIEFRNSWTKGWGDGGCYKAHLSTYVAFGSSCDFRLLVA